MLYDKRSITAAFGCLLKQPTLLDEYNLDVEDFECEKFYRIMFNTILSLFNMGAQMMTGYDIDSYVSKFPEAYRIFEDNNGLDFCDTCVTLAEISNFSYYHERIKKFSLLRYYNKQGFNIKPIYDPEVIEPTQQALQEQRLDNLSITEIIDKLENMMVSYPRMKYAINTISQGASAGKNLLALKEKLKETPEIGAPFQSGVYNSVSRGARFGKLYLNSSNSGGGKSRLAMADVCTFAVPWYYDTKVGGWFHTGMSEPSLYISTELEIDELQTLIISFISGVNESHILDGKYEPGEEERVDKAIEYITEAPLFLEVIHDFGIEDIKNIIKRYRREKGCRFVAFDYIHMSIKLISEVASASKGMKLREDQVLFMFMDMLKNLAGELNIFIETMTQLNGTYKDSAIKDETMLRGSKSCADRIDIGTITLPPSRQDLVDIKPILDKMINMPKPNLVRHIYKVRRGKLSKIRIWMYADLGTCRTSDLFVTNNDNELIKMSVVEPTYEDAEKIIEEQSVSIEEAYEELPDLEEDSGEAKTIFDW